MKRLWENERVHEKKERRIFTFHQKNRETVEGGIKEEIDEAKQLLDTEGEQDERKKLEIGKSTNPYFT